MGKWIFECNNFYKGLENNRGMDLETFTGLCEVEAGGELGDQEKKDIRFMYELTKGSFPDLDGNQVRLIYRAYYCGIQTGKGLGVVK